MSSVPWRQQADSESNETVESLAEIDSVKMKLESVSSTIGEVDKWRERAGTIEKIFDTRDLTKVGSCLQKKYVWHQWSVSSRTTRAEYT